MTPEERFTKIEQQNAGIRDLIVVSRTFLESQKQASAQIQELRQAQHATGEKLSTLIDTVNRFLKGLRGPNGSGP